MATGTIKCKSETLNVTVERDLYVVQLYGILSFYGFASLDVDYFLSPPTEHRHSIPNRICVVFLLFTALFQFFFELMPFVSFKHVSLPVTLRESMNECAILHVAPYSKFLSFSRRYDQKIYVKCSTIAQGAVTFSSTKPTSHQLDSLS